MGLAFWSSLNLTFEDCIHPHTHIHISILESNRSEKEIWVTDYQTMHLSTKLQCFVKNSSRDTILVVMD